MNTTLQSKPVAQTLHRLLSIPDATSMATRPSAQAPQPDLPDADSLMRSKTNYLEFFRVHRDTPLAVTPETGLLLYMLARHTHAKSIVEFGTSFGVSTIYMAAALRDNGGGRLISTEFDASKIRRAKHYLAEAGLLDLVEIREGDALQTLRHDLPEQIDLVLLDGAKGIYLEVLKLLEGRLRSGALVVADNMNYCPDYAARVRDPQHGYLSVPFANDVELSLRTA